MPFSLPRKRIEDEVRAAGSDAFVLDGTDATSLDALDSQTRWLDQTLASSTARWNIVVQHQPIYTCARPKDAEALKSAWEPIYRARNVDMVLQGHDHCYRRITDAEGKDAGAERRAAGEPLLGIEGRLVCSPKSTDLSDQFAGGPPLEPDTASRVSDLCYLGPVEVTTMSFIKGILDGIFGSTEPARRTGSAFSSAPPSTSKAGSDDFPDATINDVQRVRAEVKRRMDAERAEIEAELGLEEKKKRLEKAQAYLRKADVERMFNTILRETWHWPSWLEKGELDDLPRLGLEVTDVEKSVTLENKHRRHGFTVVIGGRPYGIAFLDKGRGYTPDGYGDRYGDVNLTRGGDELFVCTINEVGSGYRDWKLSLYGLKVLKDVSWLTDIAGFAEIISQRAIHRQKAWNDKRIIQDAAGIIDPTAKSQ